MGDHAGHDAYGSAVQEALRRPTRELRRAIPHVYKRFAAVRHGASPREGAEANGVAILMAGGPATIYGPRGYAAFQEFHAAAHPAEADASITSGAVN